MKKLLLSCLLLFCAAPAAWAAAAPAKPESVLFYPDMAEVTAVERLAPTDVAGRRGILLHLPGNASSEGFSALVAGEPVGPGLWFRGDDPDNQIPLTLLPDEEIDPARKALLQGLLDARRELDRLQGEQAADELRLKLWNERTPPEKGDTAEDLGKLDDLMAERLPKLRADLEETGRLLEDRQIKVAKAEKALADFDEKHADLRTLLPVEEGSGSVEVRYTYRVPASMTTSYRILAEPKDKRLTIVQEAGLAQHSGQDWKDVRIFASTLRKNQVLGPYPPAPWRVGFARPVAAFAGRADMRMKEMAEPAAAPNAAQIALDGENLSLARPVPVPVAEDRSTFRLWDLGPRRLESGREVEFRVDKETHAARYFYTLRPAVERLGFLTAEITAKEPQELPPGRARFFVDGLLMGEGPFAFNGDKGRVFLGQDPRITVTMRDLQREAGTQGFLNKENTEVWHWEINLKNARPYPVAVQVEDPAPDVADAAINVVVDSKPKPETVYTDPMQGNRKVYRWSMDLQPGQSATIDHKVTVSGPADKPLDPGRGTR